MTDGHADDEAETEAEEEIVIDYIADGTVDIKLLVQPKTYNNVDFGRPCDRSGVDGVPG